MSGSARHGLGEFVVGNSDAQAVKFFIDECFLNHTLQYLSLHHGRIHLAVGLLLLHLLGSLLVAALEVLYVNLVIAYLGDGSAGAEQCAAGGEEVTDNECQKSEAYYYKQQS